MPSPVFCVILRFGCGCGRAKASAFLFLQLICVVFVRTRDKHVCRNSVLCAQLEEAESFRFFPVNLQNLVTEVDACCASRRTFSNKSYKRFVADPTESEPAFANSRPRSLTLANTDD